MSKFRSPNTPKLGANLYQSVSHEEGQEIKNKTFECAEGIRKDSCVELHMQNW